MTCPLLLMANKNCSTHKRTNDYNCQQEDCTWFDNQKGICKLNKAKYMHDYVQKTLQGL
ncbi:hypothetical protein [Halanaerobaculum tunisiense]